MNGTYRPLKHKISKIELIIAVLAFGFVVNQLGHAIERSESPSDQMEQGSAEGLVQPE